MSFEERANSGSPERLETPSRTNNVTPTIEDRQSLVQRSSDPTLRMSNQQMEFGPMAGNNVFSVCPELSQHQLGGAPGSNSGDNAYGQIFQNQPGQGPTDSQQFQQSQQFGQGEGQHGWGHFIDRINGAPGDSARFTGGASSENDLLQALNKEDPANAPSVISDWLNKMSQNGDDNPQRALRDLMQSIACKDPQAAANVVSDWQQQQSQQSQQWQRDGGHEWGSGDHEGHHHRHHGGHGDGWSHQPPSDTPPSGNPPSDTPPSSNPPSDTPPSNNPPSDTPPSSNPPSDTPPASNPPSDTPPASNPPSDTPPASNPPSDTPPANNPPSDTPPATNPPANNPPSDTPPATNPPSGKTPADGIDMSSLFSVGDGGVTSAERQHAIDIANALPTDIKKALLNGGANMTLLSGFNGGAQGENGGRTGDFYVDSGMADQAEVHELYEMAGQISPSSIKGSWNDAQAVGLADNATAAILRGQAPNPGDLNDTVGGQTGDGDLMSNAFTADFFATHPELYQDQVGQGVLQATSQAAPQLDQYIAQAQGLQDA